ncbi:MAG: sugar phosphate isomerase/epimerase family protein [Puniceicoccaceae bacterium]
MKETKDLKWTFSTLGCPEMSLPEVVALAKRFDLQYLDLRTLEGRVDLPGLFQEQYGSPDNLARFLEGEGVSLTALNASLKLVGNKPEDREAFLEFVEWAEGTKVPLIRVFDGGSVGEELPAEAHEAALDTISWWRDQKRTYGWATDIGIETHDCLVSRVAMQQLQDSLEEPVPIIWDTHHTWKKAGDAVPVTWEVVKPYTRHIHIKDSISEPSARHPFTYVQLGEGEFDLPGTLQLLCAEDFAGMVSLEWERQWHPYLAPLEEALKRARELGWW